MLTRRIQNTLIATLFASFCASPALASDPIELSYWVYSDFAQGKALELQKTFIAEFEATHPGVKINIAGKGDDDLTTGQLTGAVSGNIPDIFMNSTSAGAQLMAAGVLKNVYSDWMAMPKDYRDQFNTDLIAMCTPKPETMYCLPYTGYGSFMFRNLTVLEEVGIDPTLKIKDWDHWLSQIKTVSKAGRIPLADMTLTWWSIGVLYSGIADSSEWGIDFANKKSKINPEKLAELGIFLEKMSPYTSGTSVWDQATTDLFISNQMAFYLNGPWANPQLEAAAKNSGLKYDWVLVPGTREDKYGGIKGYEFIGIAPNKHADIAWEFASYVAEKNQMVRWAAALGRYNSNDAAQRAPEVANHPLLAITLEATKQALFNKPPFFVGIYPSDYWQALIDGVGDIAAGDVEAVQGAQNIVDELNEVLAEN